jgi:hypothetical protein
MIEFKVTRARLNHPDAPEHGFKSENLLCEVDIAGERKIIKFLRPKSWKLYYESRVSVYVQIFPGMTDRGLGGVDSHHYNKVRRAHLFVQKVDNQFKLVTTYKVLDGTADIVSWMKSSRAKSFRNQEAIDRVSPRPIFKIR